MGLYVPLSGTSDIRLAGDSGHHVLTVCLKESGLERRLRVTATGRLPKFARMNTEGPVCVQKLPVE
jgi:hypothetical protein